MASQYPTTEATSQRDSNPATRDASEGGADENNSSAKSAQQPLKTSPVAGCGRTSHGATDKSTRSADSATGHNGARESKQSWAWNFETDDPCAECGGQEYRRSESGEWYCNECGAVQTGGDVEQRQPGWISEEERRSGPGTGPSDIQIGSSVGLPWANEGGRWAQYNDRLSYQNERLLDSLKEIRALTTALELTGSTRDDAAVLFRKTANAGLLKGRSIEAVAAACVYIAARQNEQPLTFTWVGAVSPVSENEISNTYRKLLSEFDLRMNVPVPQEFVDRIGSEVSLPLPTRNRAREILQAVTDAGEHIGQSPPGMAAAALYGAAMESDIDITQEEIADPAGVSIVTLSRQWQTIQSVLDE